MISGKLLEINDKCFSLVDLLHRLYCMVIGYVISANKHGWMDRPISCCQLTGSKRL